MKLMPATVHALSSSGAFPPLQPWNGHHRFVMQDEEATAANDLLPADALLEEALPVATLLPTVHLLTIGPIAHAVAVATVATGAASLSLPPAVDHVAVGSNGEQPRSTHDLPPSSQSATWATHPNQRPSGQVRRVWLLLDLYVDQPPTLAASVVDQRITWARQQLQRLALAVDHTNGNNPNVALLILADPAQRTDLERCRRRLLPLTTQPVYLMGAAAAEVEMTAWQERAAMALTALLWGKLPDPAPPAADTTVFAPWYTIGAAVKPSPCAPLIHALTLLTALEAVQMRLTPAVTARTGAQNDVLLPLAHLVTQLFAPTTALALPAPPPVHLYRTKPRWWRTCAHPVTMLLAYYQQQQHTRHAADQQARSAWLAANWSRWDAAWQSFSQIPARPLESAVDLLHDAPPFEQLQEQILTIAQSIDEALDALATTITAQETQTQHECQALSTFCAGLPTLSLVGIWHFCRRPRQWPRWIWQLTIELPWRLHRLSRCLTVQEQTLQQEAHLHLRRQLALAMVQDVQMALAWRREVHSHLTTLATYLDEQLTASLQALPPPWTRERVAALRQELICADQVNRQAGMHALTALLQRTAAEEWVDSTVEAIGESLAEAFAAAFAPLQQWSTAAWLQAAFPPSRPAATSKQESARWLRQRNSDPLPETALAQWLTQWMSEARLLWPPAAAQPDQPTEQWLLLPTASGAPAEPAAVLHPDLAGWANAQPNRGYQQGALQHLVAVQRRGVMA